MLTLGPRLLKTAKASERPTVTVLDSQKRAYEETTSISPSQLASTAHLQLITPTSGVTTSTAAAEKGNEKEKEKEKEEVYVAAEPLSDFWLSDGN